jgi:hypothetical protein
MNDAICLLAIILSTIAIITSIASLAMTIGMKLSTHSIEWKPLVTQELKEEDKFPEDEDEQLLKKALDLSAAKKKKKEEDPLAFLESTNF